MNKGSNPRSFLSVGILIDRHYNQQLLRATRGACDPNLNIAIEHAQHFCRLPLRKNGMNSTQFNHIWASMKGIVVSSVLIFDHRRLISWSGQHCSSLNHQASAFVKALIFLS